ncbi:hypothetical protein CRYUN_Cryun34aG0052500 [Craigia yunnanensis]
MHPGAANVRITKGWETALHIAVGARHIGFVEEVIKLMNVADLERRNKYNNTALCVVAASGITRIAEVTAAEDLTQEDYIGLLIATVTTDLFDFALCLIQHHPELAFLRDSNGETALHVLARKPSAFASKHELGTWEKFIYPWNYVEPLVKSSCPSGMSKCGCCDTNQVFIGLAGKFWHAIEKAKFGVFELITYLIQSHPDLIWRVDEHSRSIFHMSVIHRQEKIFRLIHDIGAHKDMIAAYKDKNNHCILHLAGKIAPPNRLNIVSGAALQMQRELLWFKELEKNVQPLYKEMRDINGSTPRMLYAEEHAKLVKEGEKWMKSTASSCMLVAMLITTVMFAAIFTVPGGNDNDKGTPIFLEAKSFIIFAVSDAFALFSSVTSILMFLSILTSRYAQRLAWIAVPAALIVCIPVTLFAFLQFPLLADMIQSSNGAGIFA